VSDDRVIQRPNGSPHLFNREHSWMEFNRRVLAQAVGTEHLLLERVKFLAITASNLDEFFQVRVATLKDEFDAGVDRLSPDGRSVARQLVEISDNVAAFVAEQEHVWTAELVPALHDAGIDIVGWSELDQEDRKQVTDWFEREVFPVLTPLAVDRSHPFPYISNLSLNLAVLVADPDTLEERFARVKVPPRLPRVVPTAGGRSFVLLENVIAAHLDTLFPGMEVVGQWTFRVTRSVDIDDIDDEDAEDLLAAMEIELERRRFGRAVRLEVQQGTPSKVLGLLRDEHDLDDGDITTHDAPIDMRGLWALLALRRPDLKDETFNALVPSGFAGLDNDDVGSDVFAAIARGDRLVHHPYEAFSMTVEQFVRQAADDPNVLTIKMTMYRTSFESDIARSLTRAAQNGVQVAVLVELKARFDEAVNISWARRLEQAGVHVVYGVPGLKTHAKCILVVRQEGPTLRRYVHIGTGNYNASTAGTYEDMGLMSADPVLGDDLAQLFNHITGFSKAPAFARIVTAPSEARRRLRELIENEATYGVNGGVMVKTNAVTDPEVIDALYDASRAGVPIDLITRGICCLVPGVPGRSETIRVRSIIGRFLEHSRVYFFANGRGTDNPLWMIGSADLMSRNLDRRIEVLVPIDQPTLVERLENIVSAWQADDCRSWTLDSAGVWTRTTSLPSGLDSQIECYGIAETANHSALR
jgi:polyphosphate kinase